MNSRNLINRRRLMPLRVVVGMIGPVSVYFPIIIVAQWNQYIGRDIVGSSRG